MLRKALEELTHQTLENQVVAAAQSLDAFYAERCTDLRNLSDAAARGRESSATLSERLTSFQLADPSFEALYQLDRVGRVVASTRHSDVGRHIAELIPQLTTDFATMSSKKPGTVVFADFAQVAARATAANARGVNADDYKLRMLTAVRSPDGSVIGAIVGSWVTTPWRG